MSFLRSAVLPLLLLLSLSSCDAGSGTEFLAAPPGGNGGDPGILPSALRLKTWEGPRTLHHNPSAPVIPPPYRLSGNSHGASIVAWITPDPGGLWYDVSAVFIDPAGVISPIHQLWRSTFPLDLLDAGIDDAEFAFVLWAEQTSGAVTATIRTTPQSAWYNWALPQSAPCMALKARATFVSTGRATVVWWEQVLPTYSLFAVDFQSSLGWIGSPHLLHRTLSPPDALELDPHYPHGSAMVAFTEGLQSFQAPFAVYAVQRDSTGLWSAPFEIAKPFMFSRSNCRVASNFNGYATIAWISAGILNQESLMVTHYDPATVTWSTPAALDTITLNNNQYGEYQVAMNPVGETLVAWADMASLRSSRHRRSSGWTAPAVVVTQGPLETVLHIALKLALSGEGLVAYSQHSMVSMSWSVLASSQRSANAWVASVPISSQGGPVALHPQLALDASERATAAWLEFRQTRGGSAVMANRYR